MSDRLRVPHFLNIGGVDHEVKFVKGLLANDDAIGRSCYAQGAHIEIDADATADQRREVFCHEILHRISYCLGWDRRDPVQLPESDLKALGHALAAVLRELGIEFDWSEIEA